MLVGQTLMNEVGSSSTVEIDLLNILIDGARYELAIPVDGCVEEGPVAAVSLGVDLAG